MSRYGKLGIGNVISYVDTKNKHESGSGSSTGKRARAPLKVQNLGNKDVCLVACLKDHSIAASKVTRLPLSLAII
jgi:hypothetical protein